MELKDRNKELRAQIDLLNRYLNAAKDRKKQGRRLLNEQIVQDAKHVLERLKQAS